MNTILKRVLVLSTLLLGISSYALPSYNLIEIGTLGGATSQGFNLNSQGQVVGNSETADGQVHAFLYDPQTGIITDLGTLGGATSSAADINDDGLIVGNSELADGSFQAFSYTTGGGMVSISSEENSNGTAVNNNGQILVNFVDSDGNQRAGILDGGVLTDIGDLGGASTLGININESGDVVGYSFTNDLNVPVPAIVYRDGMLIEIGTLGGTVGFGFDSNEAGTVVGRARGDDGNYNAYMWTEDGGIIDLGSFGYEHANARTLNENGLIMGWGSDDFFAGNEDGPTFNPFIYDMMTGDFATLMDLVFADAGWTNIFGSRMNDNGDIVGYGMNAAGELRAFLLQAEVPEPATVLMMVLGLGLLLRRKR